MKFDTDLRKSEVKVKGKVKVKMLMQLNCSHQYVTAYKVW